MALSNCNSPHPIQQNRQLWNEQNESCIVRNRSFRNPRLFIYYTEAPVRNNRPNWEILWARHFGDCEEHVEEEGIQKILERELASVFHCSFSPIIPNSQSQYQHNPIYAKRGHKQRMVRYAFVWWISPLTPSLFFFATFSVFFRREEPNLLSILWLPFSNVLYSQRWPKGSHLVQGLPTKYAYCFVHTFNHCRNMGRLPMEVK